MTMVERNLALMQMMLLIHNNLMIKKKKKMKLLNYLIKFMLRS